MKKLGGWIKNPKNPEKPQEKFIDEGIFVVRETAKFTHMEYDEQALKTALDLTEKQVEKLTFLKEDTDVYKRQASFPMSFSEHNHFSFSPHKVTTVVSHL